MCIKAFALSNKVDLSQETSVLISRKIDHKKRKMTDDLTVIFSILGLHE